MTGDLAPAPRRTGTTPSRNSSISPAFGYCWAMFVLDDRGGRVDVATLLAVWLAPGRQLEDPLVELHPALAQQVLLALVRPRDKAVQ